MLLACGSSDNNNTNTDVDAGSADVDASIAPLTNPYGDGSGCSAMVAGANQITIDGTVRDFEVVLPANSEGAPIVFAWHWLGGTATQTLDLMGIRALADEGAIVIAPTPTGLSVEWDILSPAAQSIDLKLFDQLLTCGWESFHIDAERVFNTGMSAGGLFTSFLAMHRSEHIASSVHFSGGILASQYVQPSTTIPMMLVWGGPTDTFGGYNFHNASIEFSQSLRDDGHFIVECEHTAGHVPPPNAGAMAWDFLQAHPRGVSPEPWSMLPASVPAFCEIP
ncbi:MAG: hypothetical protein JKY56_03825 [Kofleriaceae bacterium]|nr:hypothetical protein [Kofleriaceae bacterium]